MAVIGFSTLKDGSRNSTLAVNIACDPAQELRVVLIDVDAQDTTAHCLRSGRLPVPNPTANVATLALAKAIERAVT